MTREEAIQSLVRLAHPLDALSASLGAFEWDWDGPPLARLSGMQVASLLQRYVAGEVTGDEVETWANLLEGRDDVEFSAKAREAIFDLANPELQGPLAEVAPALLSRL